MPDARRIHAPKKAVVLRTVHLNSDFRPSHGEITAFVEDYPSPGDLICVQGMFYRSEVKATLCSLAYETRRVDLLLPAGPIHLIVFDPDGTKAFSCHPQKVVICEGCK